MKQRVWAIWMSLAAAVGLAAAFWQLMEKLSILKNKDVALSCNFNDVFSCSNVLNAHQSSIFGPPNSVIGMVMFSFFLAVGVVVWTGSKLNTVFAWVVQGLALFMLGFTLWFLFQSTYRIQSICIFCLFIGTSVLIINGAMIRHNAGFNAWLRGLTRRGTDIFALSVLWLVVAFAMLLKFA